MSTFWFTFGQAHTHSFNGKTLDKDCVIEMEAPSYEAARARMIELFGGKWSMQYEGMPEMKYYPKGIVVVYY